MSKEFDEGARPFRHGGQLGGKAKRGSKRAVNLSIDTEILRAAKEQGLNLSQILEDELRKRTKEAREEKWRAENREAIEAHNRFIQEHGIFGEEFRNW